MGTRDVLGLGFCAPCTLVASFWLSACSISINSPNPNTSAGSTGTDSGGTVTTGIGGDRSGGSSASSGGLTSATTSSGGVANSGKGGTGTTLTSSGAAPGSGGGTISSGAGGRAGAAGAAGAANIGIAGTAAKNLTWSVATLVETRSETAGTPRIALDASGNAMAIWAQSDGTAQSIYANRYTLGSGWGTATLLETSAMPADSPQIAADGSGNFVAIWRQAWNVVNGTEYGIYSSRYVTATGWSAVATIYVDTSTESVSANGDVQIATAPNGDAVAAWSVYDWSWNHTSVRANRFTVGTGWSGVTNLSTEAVQSAAGPDVAMDANGNAVVVWEQSAGTSASVQGVQAVRAAVGTAWGTPVLIESASIAATRCGSAPQVMFDASGNATAVWYQYSKPGIYANRWTTTGAAWGTPVAIADPGAATYDEGVQLAIDKNGNAMAVWNQYGGILYASRYVAGVGWGTTAIADPGNSDYSGKVAFYPNGNALAVWGQFSRNSYNIWANSYAVGTGWSTVTWEQSIINKTLDYASDPQLVIDENGTAIVVWVQNGNIYAATAAAP